jgi:hypothetical protein
MGRGGTLESSGTVTQESHHRQHLSELLSPVRVRTIECIRIRDPQEVIDHQGQYSQACRCKVKKSFPRRAVRFTFNGNIHPFLCQENPISRLLKLRIIGGIMFKRAAIFLTVVASLTLANVSHSYQLGFLNNHGQPRLQSPENGKVKHVDGGGCHVRARF